MCVFEYEVQSLTHSLLLSVEMLDVRVRALDFVVHRRYAEELMMAKHELYPRRFQRDRKLQRRWQAAHDVLVLQELLVHLTAARERRERERVRDSSVFCIRL